ncbi:MAG: lipoate--protein ligase [Coriobacteriia bacterium]|nr:lipoate--protein ligase [Coriobacteriia bacterium]
MLYLESGSLDAAYHFSVEDYLLHHADLTQPIIMLWQTKPCVMIGQYQIVELEVDKNRATEKDVAIVRRPSGGGAIFTDAGTFLLSLILPVNTDESGAIDAFPQKEARTQFAELLIEVLSEMRIPAKLEGRNDILLAGKKISGMAQHLHAGKSCTHGSLLFDADLGLLAEVLRVDDEKFRTKAVKSIRSRVLNVKEYADAQELSLGNTTEEFAQQFKSTLLAKTGATPYQLSEEQGVQIGHIYQEKYGNLDWIHRKTPKFDLHVSKRFPAGKVEVFLKVTRGAVADCAIRGDFLGTVPVDALEKQLLGLAYQREVFDDVLSKIDLAPYLGSITAEEFLSCVFD